MCVKSHDGSTINDGLCEHKSMIIVVIPQYRLAALSALQVSVTGIPVGLFSDVVSDQFSALYTNCASAVGMIVS